MTCDDKQIMRIVMLAVDRDNLGFDLCSAAQLLCRGRGVESWSLERWYSTIRITNHNHSTHNNRNRNYLWNYWHVISNWEIIGIVLTKIANTNSSCLVHVFVSVISHDFMQYIACERDLESVKTTVRVIASDLRIESMLMNFCWWTFIIRIFLKSQLRTRFLITACVDAGNFSFSRFDS